MAIPFSVYRPDTTTKTKGTFVPFSFDATSRPLKDIHQSGSIPKSHNHLIAAGSRWSVWLGILIASS
ncbi:hypothetical protein [uncultured Oxalobacter sp.]|uniref:hypothetical protein n=1 Tax=uncultured Oxalobacter sp. TaxID=337245 RepID=UPI0025980BD9|nr:hypothetical protein [uncultured Oxalobacter sp.]